MKMKPLLLLTGAALFACVLSYSVTAMAQGHGGPQISPEKMEAVRACASAKGVELPAPPPHGMMDGPKAGDQMGGHMAPPPKEDQDMGEHKGPGMMSDADRMIVDACFKANGLTPPGEPHAKEAN